MYVSSESIGTARVAISASGSSRSKPRRASPAIAGSISGSSPCRLMTTSTSSVAGDLGDAVGAGGVVRPRHHGPAAEALDGGHDARVVGGDDHGLDVRDLGRCS